jgi:molybdenum cofactor guanylyltransferase
MGRDKGSLSFGDKTILERIVDELSRHFDDLIVVAAPPAQASAIAALNLPAHITMLHDDSPFEGPVGALARGFAQAKNPAVFACSCDLPLLNGKVARALCTMLGEFDAVIPEIALQLQPLHAAYRRERSLTALRAMERQGERRLRALALRLYVRHMGEAEFRLRDPDLHSLLNVNTPEDYVRALRYVNGNGRRK